MTRLSMPTRARHSGVERKSARELDLMRQAEVAMQAVVAAKLQLFGSVGKA